MQEAGHTRQDNRMNNVGPDIDLGWVAVKEQQHHHDDAARADRGHAHEEPGAQSYDSHAQERLQGGRAVHHAFLDARLEHEQERDAHEENADCQLDHVVHAGSVQPAQMCEVPDASGGPGNAAYSECHNDFSADGAFLQVHQAGRNLCEEVKQSVGAHCHDGWHPQPKDQDG